MDNTILKTDSYKFSHWKQYPPSTQYIRSYLEARGGPYPNVLTFGALQVFLDELFARPITQSMIDEADDFVTGHMGPGIFNRDGWEHILRAHGGFLPLRVRAVREGVLVPIRNCILTIENTDPKVPWLTGYFEAACYPWYPYTVATMSNHCRQIIRRYLVQTGDPDLIDFKLHDFGYRGTTDSCHASQAMIGGLAHLVNFTGTDNMPAVWAARRYYNCRMAGFSIPASEHSTMASWGRQHEADAFRNMLTQFSTGLVAVVSDSYNIYHACEKLWGEALRDEVLNRQGVLVVRPDSGRPTEVVLKCLNILAEKFGSTINRKGFRVLNDKVRLIQGDGVDPQTIETVLDVIQMNGFSADNIAFGMGGALLQKCNRDTMRWAFKCMQIVAGGFEYDVFKSPIDDVGKRSKAGNLTLYYTPGHGARASGYETRRRKDPADDTSVDVLDVVYENGRIPLSESLDTIRARACGAATNCSHNPQLLMS